MIPPNLIETESCTDSQTTRGIIGVVPHKTKRDQEVEELCMFQRRAVEALEDELSKIDEEIAKAEAQVAESHNKVQALKGLVTKRQMFHDGSTDRNNLSWEHEPRIKLNQKNWRFASNSAENSDLSAAEEAHSASGNGNGEQLFKPPLSSIQTVGIIYSEFSKRFEAPRQSFVGPAGDAQVLLRHTTDRSVQSSLQEVAVGSHIWLLYWLDRNAGFWREKVRPPRARGGWRVGVFATRSPHRPTPVGLSLGEVTNVDVAGLRIYVRGLDVLDETPLLAWKKYDPLSESHTGIRSGWLDDKDKLQPLYYDEISPDSGICGTARDSHAAREVPVKICGDVEQKIAFVNGKSSINMVAMLNAALSRVVRGEGEQCFTLDGKSEWRPVPEQSHKFANVYPLGAWRVWFEWDDGDTCVRVLNVTSGIRKEVLCQEGSVDREVREHREFKEKFGEH